MTEAGTFILSEVNNGSTISSAVKASGLDPNQYYRGLPKGERTVISIARNKWLIDHAKPIKSKQKKEYRLATSALPKQTKIDFAILAHAKGRKPADLLAMFVIKAVDEAKGLTV